MSVDDGIKILLAVSASFAIAGIAYQLMRLIGSLADTVKDLRPAVKNISEVSTKLVSDYDFISKQVKGFANSVGNIGRNVIDPIGNLLGFLKRFRPKTYTDEADNSDDEF